jgi:mycothiol S-conjugate amidase
LLSVHAHPDDESSKSAGAVARYAAEGVRCVLVSCTGGEAGDNRLGAETGDVAAVRAAELRNAVRILGYEATHLLGYRDSGVDGTAPGGFATTDFHAIVSQLVSVFRREQPDVVVTYDPGYAARHPDHLRSYEAACAAFDATGGAGRGPLKLYGCRTHSPGKLRAMHDWLTSTGKESPYGSALADDTLDETTTRIDVGNHLSIARQALLAHHSQVAPDDPWFFSVPVDAMRRIYPYEDYVLLRSRVPVVADEGHERDLFAGIDGLSPT